MTWALQCVVAVWTYVPRDWNAGVLADEVYWVFWRFSLRAFDCITHHPTCLGPRGGGERKFFVDPYTIFYNPAIKFIGFHFLAPLPIRHPPPWLLYHLAAQALA